MTSKITRGMVLAAGFGARLQPLTKERPKPLMEVLGEPLISYSLQNLKQAGCEQVVINTHHLGEQLPQFLGERYRGMGLLYSHEKEILGTGGGIAKARECLVDKSMPFMLLQGDVIADFDPALFLQTHRKNQVLVTLGLKQVDNFMGYGAVGTDAQGFVRTISDWVPCDGPITQKRFFCGVHLISPEIFSYFPPGTSTFGITNEVYPALLKQGKHIGSVEVAGDYWDVGTPERLFDVNMKLLSGESKLIHLNTHQGLRECKAGVWVSAGARVHPKAKLISPVVIQDGAVIQEEALVGPNVVVGKYAHVGARVKVQDAVIFSKACIAPDMRFRQMIKGVKEEVFLDLSSSLNQEKVL